MDFYLDWQLEASIIEVAFVVFGDRKYEEKSGKSSYRDVGRMAKVIFATVRRCYPTRVIGG